MKKAAYLFGIIAIMISCDSPSPHWQPIISDALNQAIALEKLPDVHSVLLDSDTIWIYPAKHNEETYIFDEFLASELPYHIDKWIVQSIDSKSIKQRSAHNEFSYLSISNEQIIDDRIIYIIMETSLPPNSDLRLIDRGRITVTFEYKNKMWVIKNMVIWYG